ncbi:hypothetical protein DSO57_1019420 [Entomophthora muscae]|uniref:Uncharacterized protein n=1 Tax=Entomophthora muscae TaxID=34485 RepID=A0ACC2RIP9_9FUNG|nr:hypothetical protein DSO57_1019420 [Entomophthora muscae]
METSLLVEVDATNNPPMETSPLVGAGLAVNPNMNTTTPLKSEVNYNPPMDTLNTPTDKELVDNCKSNLPMNTEELEMNDGYKPVVPGIPKQPLEADTLKIEELNKGISTDKLFEDTSITSSLADIFQESPTLRQKAHKAVSALRPHRKEELFLAGTGAPRTEGAVNKHMAHSILDRGAYRNSIAVKFLESLPDATIPPSDVTFIMADGSKKFCLGVVKGLKLWIGGAEIEIDAAINNHHKYTLLMGRQTMTKLGITTQYAGNNWTIKDNNLKVQLYVTFDTPQNHIIPVQTY